MNRRKIITLNTHGGVDMWDPNTSPNRRCDPTELPELTNEIWLEIVAWYTDRMDILTGWHLTKQQTNDRWSDFFNNGIKLAKRIQKFVGRKYNVEPYFNTDMFWWDKKSDKITYK